LRRDRISCRSGQSVSSNRRSSSRSLAEDAQKFPPPTYRFRPA
jgi:hypothetical protein